MTVNVTNNSFAVDQPQGGQVFDLNNPPRARYKHQPFPKAVYDQNSGRTMIVKDEKELKKAQKAGYDMKPAPGRDYSKVSREGIAPVAEKGPDRGVQLSADDLEEVEEG